LNCPAVKVAKNLVINRRQVCQHIFGIKARINRQKPFVLMLPDQNGRNKHERKGILDQYQNLVTLKGKKNQSG